MKILYLSYYFHPDITAAAFRSSDFVEFLEHQKIEHRVITTFPHKSDESIGTDDKPTYPLKRIRLKEMNNNKFLSYVLHYLSFIPKAFQIALKWRLKGWRPSIVFISSPPIFIGLLGLMLKLMFRCKLVLEVRDIWPESAVAAGQLNPKGRPYKIARFFEKTLYRKSNGIVCVGKYMKNYIAKYTDKEICIAYNGYKEIPSTKRIVENAGAERENQQVSKKIRLAYAGNFGLVQGLECLIEAFAELIQVDTRYKWELHFFGTGVLENKLRNQVTMHKIDEHIVFRGAFPKHVLNEKLKEMDILFLGLIKSEALENTIPSKLFDYLSFGKPILAALSGEGKEILALNRSNIIVDECTSTAIFHGLVKMEENFSERIVFGKKNKEVLKQGFTREKNNAKILAYLGKMLSEK